MRRCQRGVGAVPGGARERRERVEGERGQDGKRVWRLVYYIPLHIGCQAVTLYAGTRGHNAQTTDIGAGVGYFGVERPPMDRTRR